MIKIYGKGDTVNNSEFWDGRTTYNGLKQYLKKNEDAVAIRDIFNDNTELFAFVESINSSQYYVGGVVKHSFSNEFNIKSSDFFELTIGNITKRYVRCSPGIGANNGIANINKPATELATAELKNIFGLKEKDDENVEIKYDYVTDTFKARISIIVNKHMERLEFTNNSDFDNDLQPGYNTGIEMLYRMYSHPFLTELMSDALGDELTKIDLEKTVEVTSTGTYYWCLDSSGLLTLSASSSGMFAIGNLTIVDLSIGIDSFDNTHVYTGDTQVVSGDMVVTGNLTVEGTTTTINSETVTIEDNIILLNSNQTGTPLPSLQSGIEVNRGDETNYQFIFDESTSSFLIGEIGSLQPVATRTDSMGDRGIAIWNDTNKQLETDGIAKITDATNSTSTTTGALQVTGGVGVQGDIYANRVYGAVWNDVAEFMKHEEESSPGDVLYMSKNGIKKTNKKCDKKVVGVHSDTYGYVLGSENKESKTPVGLTGRVKVKIKDKCKIGDLLISNKDGFASVKKWYNFKKGVVIGKALEENDGKIRRIEMLIMMS